MHKNQAIPQLCAAICALLGTQGLAADHDGLSQHRKSGITGGVIAQTFPTGTLPHIVHYKGTAKLQITDAHTVWCNDWKNEDLPIASKLTTWRFKNQVTFAAIAGTMNEATVSATSPGDTGIIEAEVTADDSDSSCPYCNEYPGIIVDNETKTYEWDEPVEHKGIRFFMTGVILDNPENVSRWVWEASAPGVQYVSGDDWWNTYAGSIKVASGLQDTQGAGPTTLRDKGPVNGMSPWRWEAVAGNPISSEMLQRIPGGVKFSGKLETETGVRGVIRAEASSYAYLQGPNSAAVDAVIEAAKAAAEVVVDAALDGFPLWGQMAVAAGGSLISNAVDTSHNRSCGLATVTAAAMIENGRSDTQQKSVGVGPTVRATEFNMPFAKTSFSTVAAGIRPTRGMEGQVGFEITASYTTYTSLLPWVTPTSIDVGGLALAPKVLIQAGGITFVEKR
jgi:hypothetical protein